MKRAAKFCVHACMRYSVLQIRHLRGHRWGEAHPQHCLAMASGKRTSSAKMCGLCNDSQAPPCATCSCATLQVPNDHSMELEQVQERAVAAGGPQADVFLVSMCMQADGLAFGEALAHNPLGEPVACALTHLRCRHRLLGVTVRVRVLPRVHAVMRDSARARCHVGFCVCTHCHVCTLSCPSSLGKP